jgi:transketolase
MKQKICMVGLASGLVLGTLGFTHACIEDIGVLRSIPNIDIVSPADSLETVKAIQSAINSNKSTYIRLTGSSNNPIVYNSDYDFKIGKSVELLSGKDITIFSSGASVYRCLQAAKLLEQNKISCSVINMHTIKPIDKEKIEKEAEEKKFLFSVEEHNVIGGLGSAISEHLVTLKKKPDLTIMGINDVYGKGGTYEYLLEKHGLSTNRIVSKILEKIN